MHPLLSQIGQNIEILGKIFLFFPKSEFNRSQIIVKVAIFKQEVICVWRDRCLSLLHALRMTGNSKDHQTGLLGTFLLGVKMAECSTGNWW
jgi:hypothetical protein